MPTTPDRLQRDDTLLLVVDVQEKFVPVIHEIETVIENTIRLVKGARILGVPVVATEQYPRGLGATDARIASELGDAPVMEKLAFSCCGEESILRFLRNSGRTQLLLCGIETHVCIAQTALDAVADGWSVHVVADAVSSRSVRNRDLALRRMAAAGCVLTSTEMALFELLGRAGTDEFKAVAALVK